MQTPQIIFVDSWNAHQQPNVPLAAAPKSSVVGEEATMPASSTYS
jgi:hypothetical protein